MKKCLLVLIAAMLLPSANAASRYFVGCATDPLRAGFQIWGFRNTASEPNGSTTTSHAGWTSINGTLTVFVPSEDHDFIEGPSPYNFGITAFAIWFNSANGVQTSIEVEMPWQACACGPGEGAGNSIVGRDPGFMPDPNWTERESVAAMRSYLARWPGPKKWYHPEGIRPGDEVVVPVKQTTPK